MKRAPIADLSPGERRLDGPSRTTWGACSACARSAFVAFDPTAGTEADAVVVRMEGDAIAVRFGVTRAGTSAPRALTWIQGYAKADKCDAVVRDATELGATRIVVATTRRSVVRLDDGRASARVVRWTRIAEEAARQCGRSDAPLVERPLRWAEALACAGPEAARFCLWERATDPLAPGLFDALARDVPLAFACGPEGGIEDDEVALATAQGWKATSLGPLLLRTETVAAAVLGAVRVWSGLGA